MRLSIRPLTSLDSDSSAREQDRSPVGRCLRHFFRVFRVFRGSLNCRVTVEADERQPGDSGHGALALSIAQQTS